MVYTHFYKPTKNKSRRVSKTKAMDKSKIKQILISFAKELSKEDGWGYGAAAKFEYEKILTKYAQEIESCLNARNI